MKPFVPRMSVQILGISLSSSLRCYPPRFGLQLVQMFHDLISEKAGMPKLPEVVPSAAETFGSMSFDDDVWPESTFAFLRPFWGCYQRDFKPKSLLAVSETVAVRAPKGT